MSPLKRLPLFDKVTFRVVFLTRAFVCILVVAGVGVVSVKAQGSAGSAPNTSGLQIIKATYGAGAAQIDVTAKMQTAIQNGKASIRIGRQFFRSDPAFGKVKTATVVFAVNGQQYTTSAREGDELSFPASVPVQQQQPSAQNPPAIQTANVAAPIVSQEPKPNLAPEGIFYLIERVAVKTDSGVAGFAPGTRVKLIKDQGDKILVSNEEMKFEVPSDKLTNDLDLAALAGRQDAQSQQALEQAMNQRLAAYRVEKEKEIPVYEQQQRDVEAGSFIAAAAAKGENPLDRGAYHEKQSVPPWWRPYMYHRHYHGR